MGYVLAAYLESPVRRASKGVEGGQARYIEGLVDAVSATELSASVGLNVFPRHVLTSCVGMDKCRRSKDTILQGHYWLLLTWTPAFHCEPHASPDIGVASRTVS